MPGARETEARSPHGVAGPRRVPGGAAVRGPVGLAVVTVLLGLAGTGCGGSASCDACPAPDDIRQPLRVALGGSPLDTAEYRVCAGRLGCWTATVLLPDPRRASRHSTEARCLLDAPPSEATCHLDGKGLSWDAGEPARLVVEVRGPAAPLRDATVTVTGLGVDRRAGRAVTDYEEERGECSCGDSASADVDLR